MDIKLHVPATLRSYCDGASELALSASTVREALEQLERSFPPLYKSVCDETGEVRRHVNLFVNTSLMLKQDGLDTPLRAGDVLSIMPAVSGG